ncbi:hypothetical protein ACYPKM_01010 [Pseudomonas aeruginosa]
MSSEECKELLSEEFPGTNEKDWKRVTKYKNHHGEEVRQFRHPEVGDVWVVDEDDELVVHRQKNVSSAFKKGELSPADYMFSVAKDTFSPLACISFTLKVFYDANGHMYDQHDAAPGSFLPKSWGAGEEMEGVWSVASEISLDDVIRELLKLGFQRSDAFDELTEGRSTVPSRHSREHGGPSL